MSWLTDPWTWWIAPFVDNAFMRDALVASLLAVVATSLVGTWVVLRGLTFLGDALAHGVLPGVAIAFVIGTSPTVGALLAALVMVGALNVLRSRSPLPDDTSIGVLFVGFLALAVVVMSSQSASYAGDLNRFLFGSVTGVTDGDLVRQAVAAALALVGVIVFHRSFLVLSFDEVQAELLGLRPRLANGVLLALVAIAVVATFETVGNLLVFAFLVAPPATASLLVRRVPHIMAAAVAFGALAVVIGLLVSFHQGSVAPSATMTLVATAMFVLAVVARAVIEATGRHSAVRFGTEAHQH